MLESSRYQESPLSREDWETLALTITGEIHPGISPYGAAQTNQEIANILETIQMRAAITGQTIREVVRAPDQYSTWDTPETRRVARENYAQNRGAVDRALEGFFNGTNRPSHAGLTNYYSPGGMPGGRPPGWARRMDHITTTGPHRFYREQRQVMSKRDAYPAGEIERRNLPDLPAPPPKDYDARIAELDRQIAEQKQRIMEFATKRLERGEDAGRVAEVLERAGIIAPKETLREAATRSTLGAKDDVYTRPPTEMSSMPPRPEGPALPQRPMPGPMLARPEGPALAQRPPPGPFAARPEGPALAQRPPAELSAAWREGYNVPGSGFQRADIDYPNDVPPALADRVARGQQDPERVSQPAPDFQPTLRQPFEMSSTLGTKDDAYQRQAQAATGMTHPERLAGAFSVAENQPPTERAVAEELAFRSGVPELNGSMAFADSPMGAAEANSPLGIQSPLGPGTAVAGLPWGSNATASGGIDIPPEFLTGGSRTGEPPNLSLSERGPLGMGPVDLTGQGRVNAEMPDALGIHDFQSPFDLAMTGATPAERLEAFATGPLPVQQPSPPISDMVRGRERIEPTPVRTTSVSGLSSQSAGDPPTGRFEPPAVEIAEARIPRARPEPPRDRYEPLSAAQADARMWTHAELAAQLTLRDFPESPAPAIDLAELDRESRGRVPMSTLPIGRAAPAETVDRSFPGEERDWQVGRTSDRIISASVPGTQPYNPVPDIIAGPGPSLPDMAPEMPEVQMPSFGAARTPRPRPDYGMPAMPNIAAPPPMMEARLPRARPDFGMPSAAPQQLSMMPEARMPRPRPEPMMGPPMPAQQPMQQQAPGAYGGQAAPGSYGQSMPPGMVMTQYGPIDVSVGLVDVMRQPGGQEALRAAGERARAGSGLRY